MKKFAFVFQIIGPGMMASVHQACLSHELTLRGIPFERHKKLSIEYKDTMVNDGYQLDVVVADNLIAHVEK
jgi:GxxExxY protein